MITASGLSACSAMRPPQRLLVLSRALSSPSGGARPFAEIPQPRWSLPFFGTALHYRLGRFNLARRQDTLLEFRRRYGPIVRETINGETAVHLFDPDDFQLVYGTEGRMPSIVPLIEPAMRFRREHGYSPGVGNINGEEWYRLRSAVRRLMMQPLSVAKFIQKEQEVTNDFIERLAAVRDPDSGLVPNLELEVGKWNFETAAYLVFGQRFHILDSAEGDTPTQMIRINTDLLDKAVQLRFSLPPLYRLVSTPLWRRLVRDEDRFYKYVLDLFNDAVVECRRLVEDGTGGVEDEDRFLFLKHVLRREELSMMDCHAVCQSLFTDGFTTTLPTSIAQLYCLAANPGPQERLRREVCEVVGTENDHVTYDQLSRMPYLRACIKEGLRLFPIGLEVSRITHHDLVLSGYHVPAGTEVELNNFAILRDEQFFYDPCAYLPERWLRGNSGESAHPYAHIPFSHGPRQCLGRRFAEQEMSLLLVKILQRFRLEWRGQRPMSQRWRILNTPDVPADIAFLARGHA